MLLDPYRDPREVWIALRSDGVRGSGTQSDPYDGSVRLAAGIFASVERDSANDRRAIVVTASNHGLIDGDVVSISGATISIEPAPLFDGEFWISDTTSNSFKFTASVALPAGIAIATVARVIYRFDEVMRGIAENSIIHFGPGIFETRGLAPRTYAQSLVQGWSVKAGQKLLGSGMGVTIVKLMHATHDSSLTVAIGHGPYISPSVFAANGFEVSDLTADCNLRSQPRDTVAKAAIAAIGRNIRIRRIHAVDFGTQSVAECFVITSGGGDPRPEFTEPVDCRIEECILERPSQNNIYTTSYILLNAQENPANGHMGYHRGCVVRNCVIDGQYQENPVRVARITFSGAVATAVTSLPHGRNTDDWVIISGAMENGSPSAFYNGSFQMTRIDDTTFQYTTPSPGPSVVPSGDIWLGKWPSNLVGVGGTLADPTITLVSGRTYQIKTATPHFRRPGNNVLIGGVVLDNVLAANPFNGSFPIDSVPSTTELIFTLRPADPEPGGDIDWDSSAILIGSGHAGITADGGTAAIVEGNEVMNCFVGVYHDTWRTKNLLIRNNRFHGVNIGIQQNMGGFSLMNYAEKLPWQGESLTHGGPDGRTATFTSVLPHGFALGQGVEISRARKTGVLLAPYNGFFSVISVGNVPPETAPRIFTYEMKTSPIDDPDEARYSALWQIRQLKIEDNTIELSGNFHPKGWGPPRGVMLSSGDYRPIYTFGDVVIRRNLIRQADGVVDSSGQAGGIDLFGCENTGLEDNIIDLNPNFRIRFNVATKRVLCFNNTDSAGQRIAAFDIFDYHLTTELADRVEEALLLSI